ncbi:MAG: hypothetical protein JJU05_12785 [Verrucomicrobia bacterium]|nr:hypothetical protein [Verrucomicrobiota bacterium]MCH8529149.1 hypothetical protein [Kiritimatiellia bacterium]
MTPIRRRSLRLCLTVLILQAGGLAFGMTVTGYDPEAHDRFSGGYPSAPVPNTSPDFVGLPFDWSGVGWASNSPKKSFGFVSPQHYLVARHFGGAGTVRIFGADGTRHDRTQRQVIATELGVVFQNQTVGDLSLGILNTPFSQTAMPVRYGVLDRNTSSTSNATTAYNNTPLLIYGHGSVSTNSTRVAGTPINSVTVSGNTHSFTTPRTDLQLEDLDSGGPAFALWTNPNGQSEIALIGNHAGINDTVNAHNFLGTFQVINSLNDLMRPDGRALRVVGPHSHTWVGSSSTNINQNSAWGISGNRPPTTNATSDRFVLFDGDTADSLSVNINTNYTLRGLYFTGNQTFTFSGSNTLTVGRGGLTLYADTLQQFTAPLALGSSQVWSTGNGTVSVQSLNLNGHLLEILGDGTVQLNGPVTGGSGGLAVDSGHLVVNSNTSYSGVTWVHGGLLTVHADLSSSERLILKPGAGLTGSGTLPPIEGGGRVQPSGGILTAASVNGSQGLSFSFLFANDTPGGNETLRLTAATPFTAPLSAGSTLRIYLVTDTPAPGQTWRGGFFTDQQADFLSHLSSAQTEVYLLEDDEYRLLTPEDGEVLFETVPHTLEINGSPVEGRVLHLTVVPPPDTFARWAYETFPEGTDPALMEPLAAPNDAGVPNLVSYAHGWDPLNPDLSDRPFAFPEDGTLVIRWGQNPDAPDITATVQISTDLITWTDTALIPAYVTTENGKDLYEVRPPLTDLAFYRVFWQFSSP